MRVAQPSRLRIGAASRGAKERRTGVPSQLAPSILKKEQRLAEITGNIQRLPDKAVS